MLKKLHFKFIIILLTAISFCSFAKGSQVYCLEGNIGSGKSTLIRLVQERLSLPVVTEPVAEWQSVKGYNFLDIYYKDTPRWAYAFLVYANTTRIEQQEKGLSLGSSCLVERSAWSNKYCFGKLFFDTKVLTDLEWHLYKLFHSVIVPKCFIKPSGFIYIRTSPDICFKRLKKRDRKEEVGISLEYLELLHENHDEWLLEGKDLEVSLYDIPVLILDGDRDFEHDEVLLDTYLQKIQMFTSSLNKTMG